MSTLTKVLIVLLSVFSLFLCGVVVTYVANAENYKDLYDRQRRDIQTARNNQDDAENALAECKEAAEKTQQTLEQQISDMTINVSNLQAQLEDLKRQNDQLVQRVATSAATVTMTSETQKTVLEQAQAAQARVRDLEDEQTRLESDLKETNRLLLEKIAIIEDLQTKNKQLAQANQELETGVNQYLQQRGQVAAVPRPVTPTPGIALPATPPTRQIDLNGRIVRVDNQLAEISIGSAAGVRPNMTFHVTRGAQFICNLEILDGGVDTDSAVGVLKLVQGTEPRPGDTVKTNL
ncbi:MAG: hypothetical protein JW993_09925 [Sedimentisphaerales bacterium]|nr:hypothetical protein [Sedimentisphaerales bacterium]